MIEIVQIGKEEVATVRELAHQIWPTTFAEILSKDQIEYMLNWMYDEAHLREQISHGQLYYLIREYNTPKGFIALEPNFPKEDVLRIHKLYVLPEEQGKGYGRLLINHAIDLAFDLGAKSLHLNVNRFNKSVEFYRHLGFVIVQEENIDIGQGYLMEDYVMELNLFP